MNRNLIWTFAAMAVAALILTAARADAQILFQFGGTPRTDGGQVVGITLNSSGNTITSLGFYDHGQDGIAASYQLGLWDSSFNLVRTATVTPASPLTGDFRYAAITPITIGSFNNPDSFTIGALLPANLTDTWLDDSILILSTGYSGAGTGQYSGPSGTLVYPGTYEASGAYYVVNANGPADPIVPEPAALALLVAAALIGLCARIRNMGV